MEVIRCTLREGRTNEAEEKWHPGKRSTAGGEEIAPNQLNFSDWECGRVAQNWHGFPSG